MEDFNQDPTNQFGSPLFDSARGALAAEFSAVASPRPAANGPGPTHPAPLSQAPSPASPAVAADYANLTGLYQKC